MMKTMDATTLKQALAQGDVLVIDVREPDEYAEAHIVGTVHMPLSTVALDSIPKANGKKLVFHCRSGKRSAYACEQLLQTQPALEVYNLEGGILEWITLGYPVERDE